MSCTGVEIAPLIMAVIPFATAYMAWVDKKQANYYSDSEEQDFFISRTLSFDSENTPPIATPRNGAVSRMDNSIEILLDSLEVHQKPIPDVVSFESPRTLSSQASSSFDGHNAQYPVSTVFSEEEDKENSPPVLTGELEKKSLFICPSNHGIDEAKNSRQASAKSDLAAIITAIAA
jgi:hypothetical protein